MITRETKDLSEIDFLKGEVLLIDKEADFTSFNAVSKIRKIVDVKKVGHAGTLDPKATGLLIICTGKKTKEIYKFQEFDKTYTGIFELGKRTLSMDAETEIVEEKSIEGITESKLVEVKDSFLGRSLQIPPMYSALKHKGKALYKYARKGQEVVRKEREINISKFEFTKIDIPFVHFIVTVSKGTYIRVLADDFGRRLGCGAYLNSLRRVKIGNYSVDDALSVKEFEKVYLESIKTSIN